MSISTLQEKLLGKGCGVVISVGMAVIMSAFVFNNCGKSDAANGQQDGDNAGPPVATIGNRTITETDISTMSSNIVKQDEQSAMEHGQPPPPQGYAQDAGNTAKALGTLLNSAALQIIIAKDNIPTTVDAYMNVYTNTLLQPQIDQMKMQLSSQGKIKPNATPADVDKAFKAAIQKTPSQILSEQTAKIKSLLQDSKTANDIKTELAEPLVLGYLSSKLAPSDADLKANYDTYQIKRIFIAAGPKVNVDAKVQQVEDALKGGMSFEAAMDKFSDEAPMGKGKPKSASMTNMPSSLIDSNPDFKGIKGQKVGYTTEPRDVSGGKAIFKLTGIEVPKDFDTNKQMYVQQFAQPKAQEQLQGQLKQVIASSTKWSNEGYKELYELLQAMTSPAMDQSATLSKIIQEASATASSGSGADRTPATYAAYLAEDTVYSMAGPNKSKLVDQRIDVLNAVLAGSEDFNIRMELADLYLQKKDGPNALSNLVAASKNNVEYDAEGQERFGDIAAKGLALVSKGLMKSADLKDLNAAQDAWKKGKVDANAEAVKEKAAAADQAKSDAEIEKKNEATVKKQEEENKGAKAPSDQNHPNLLPPGSTTPPSPATTATGGAGH